MTTGRGRRRRRRRRSTVTVVSSSASPATRPSPSPARPRPNSWRPSRRRFGEPRPGPTRSSASTGWRCSARSRRRCASPARPARSATSAGGRSTWSLCTPTRSRSDAIVRAADRSFALAGTGPDALAERAGRRRRRRAVAGMDTGGRGSDDGRHLRPTRRQVPRARCRHAAPRARPDRGQAAGRERRAVASCRGTAERSTVPTPRVEAAAALGFPVMLKAAAGGGRAGIRRVDDAAELAGGHRTGRGRSAGVVRRRHAVPRGVARRCPPPRGDGRRRRVRQGLDVRPARRHAAPPGRQGRDRVGRRRPHRGRRRGGTRRGGDR